MNQQKTIQFTLHLDIHDAKVPQLLQVCHLVALCELAEGTVEPSLPFVEVVRAHRLAGDCVIGVLIRVGQRLQLAR